MAGLNMAALQATKRHNPHMAIIKVQQFPSRRNISTVSQQDVSHNTRKTKPSQLVIIPKTCRSRTRYAVGVDRRIALSTHPCPGEERGRQHRRQRSRAQGPRR